MTQTERVSLRPWRQGDGEALVKIANNRNIWRNVRDRFPHPYTATDAEAWLRLVGNEGEPARNLAVVLGERLIGGAGLEPLSDVYRFTAEIGYWLGVPFWGRGLGTEAVRRLTNYAFANFDLIRLQAAVYEWNPASRRVLEKAGYRLEGRLASNVFKDGRLIDCFLYACLRDGR